MSIEERVISVIKENLENNKGLAITLESELTKDLDIDSLNALTILFGLEKEFSISLDESAFAAYKTVEDVVVALKKEYPQLQGT